VLTMPREVRWHACRTFHMSLRGRTCHPRRHRFNRSSKDSARTRRRCLHRQRRFFLHSWHHNSLQSRTLLV